MKRTTYIIIGMLLTVFVLVIGGIVFGSLWATSHHDGFYRIEGTPVILELPACRVLKFEKIGVETKEVDPHIYRLYNDFVLQDVDVLLSDTASSTSLLTVAADMQKHLSMEQRGDTLIVGFRFTKELLPEELRYKDFARIKTADLRLSLSPSVEVLHSDVSCRWVVADGMHREEFTFLLDNRLRVRNSGFAHLRIEQAMGLQLQSGRADNLHLNLDRVSSWATWPDSFYIDTEHLRGNRYFHNDLKRGECRRVLWTPTGKDGRLGLVLPEASEIIVAEE